MKKLISLVLALALSLSLAAAAGIAVSAEEYDYYNVVDKTKTYEITNAQYFPETVEGLSGSNNNNVTQGVDNDGNPAFVVARRGATYDCQAINYFDKENIGKLAKNSVGFRVWVQAEKDNDKCVTSKSILVFGFRSTVNDTDTCYTTFDKNGNLYLDKITTEGAWVTYMWDKDAKYGGKYVSGQNRIWKNGGAISADVFTDEYLSNMNGITVSFNDSQVSGAKYFVGDWQFIYPQGKAPGGDQPTVEEPAITMDAGASMRIDSKTDGIRYSATVDKTALDEFTAAGATVTEIGTLIAKEGTDESKIVVDNAVEVKQSGVTIEEGKIVVAKYANADMQAVADANAYTIVGSLVEIKENHADQKFVAKAYIKYTNADGEGVIYSNLSDARSITDVAVAAKADTDFYNSLCDTHKSAIDKWVK